MSTMDVNGRPSTTKDINLLLDLDHAFDKFSCFGENNHGKTINLYQISRWFKRARIIDGKHITLLDVGIVFRKFQRYSITQAEFVEMVEDIALQKRVSKEFLIDRLIMATYSERSRRTSNAMLLMNQLVSRSEPGPSQD